MSYLSRAFRASRMPSACTIVNANGIVEVPGSLKREYVPRERIAQAAEQPRNVETEKLYYVTSKRLGWAMNGERHGMARNPRGSIYGVFESEDDARSFIERRGLRMVAMVVCK